MPVPHSPTTRSKVVTHDEGQQHCILDGIRLTFGNTTWSRVINFLLFRLLSAVSPDDAHASINRLCGHSTVLMALLCVMCTTEEAEFFIYKYWWEEELNLVKEQAMQSYNTWKKHR